ncbi:UNVERIFIED_CONTAM: hypothetical protein FKN15_016443 [Acipenser sinensis]
MKEAAQRAPRTLTLAMRAHSARLLLGTGDSIQTHTLGMNRHLQHQAGSVSLCGYTFV